MDDQSHVEIEPGGCASQALATNLACHGPNNFSVDSSFPSRLQFFSFTRLLQSSSAEMPFSMLGQSSKATTANVIRTHTNGSKMYAHGLHTRSAAGAVQSAHKSHITMKRNAPRAGLPNSSPMMQQHRCVHNRASRLCSKEASGRTVLATNPPYGVSYVTKRARSTIAELFRGNEEYMANMSKENPGLLASLANEGQRMFFQSCISLTYDCHFLRTPIYAGRLLR
jgi:hypothetical protein